LVNRLSFAAPPGVAVLVASVVGATSIEAAAQATAVEGVVVQVERDDLVLDVGSGRGAVEGDVVELWRPLHLRHPVTGKVLTDRFLIGRLRLSQVRPTLSLARPEGQLARSAEAGDVVVIAKAPAAPEPDASASAPVASPPAASSPSGADDEARVLSEMFDALHGATVSARIRAYEAYVYAHPQGRYVQTLWEEARALRKLLSAPAQSEVAPKKSPGPAAEAQRIDHVVAGQPLRIALALHGDARGAVLHARKAGEATYSSQPMTKVGSDYWAATVPGATVQSPALEWFVEAVASDGTHPVVGTPTDPAAAQVQDVRPSSPRRVSGQAQIWTDYATFSTRRNNDYVWQTEGVMGARFDDEGIRALRTGFGVYRGVGGTLQRLDVLDQPGTAVGLTYGYLETELGVTPTLSIAARGIIGLRDDGVNGGASGFVRIGSDLATSLLFGGEILGGIGVRGITEFDWNSFKNVPIVLRSEVTNQPAGTGSDVGVRLIAQAGYRVLPNLVLSGRASYQGRTINHAGPGVGAAVAYTW
jgi:hypothetical protein